MRWKVLATILLLVSAPLADASLFSADLRTPSLSATGHSLAQGPLVALAFGSAWAPSNAARIDGFVLAADAVDVHIDHRDTNQTVASIGVSEGYWSSDYRLASPRLTALAQGAKLEMFAMPSGSGTEVTVAGLQSSAQAASTVRVEQTMYLQPQGRLPLRAETRDTVDWSAQDVRVTLDGDFLIAIWDLDLVVQESGQRIESGTKTRPLVSDPTGTVRGVEEWHESQVYLSVQGGTLELLFQSLSPGQLFMSETHLKSDGTLTLRDAQGSIRGPSGTLVADHDTITLEGRVESKIGARNAFLEVALQGDPEGAAMGSQMISIAEPGPQSSMGWALGFVAAPGLALFGLMVRRRHRTTSFLKAQEAMEKSDYGTASDLSRPLLRSRRFSGDAAVLRVVALLRLARVDEAEETLNRWPPRGHVAMRDYLMAHVLCLRGRWPEAEARLKDCLAAAPALRADVSANTAFKPILARLGIQSRPTEGYT